MCETLYEMAFSHTEKFLVLRGSKIGIRANFWTSSLY